MRIARPAAIVAVALFSVLTASAHHSFTAEFDIGRRVEFTGTVTRVEWTNPHAWVFLETEDDEGVVQSWAVELLGVNTLMGRGLTPDRILPGDLILVEGYGARNGTNTANASALTKSDTGEELWASAPGDRN